MLVHANLRGRKDDDRTRRGHATGYDVPLEPLFASRRIHPPWPWTVLHRRRREAKPHAETEAQSPLTLRRDQRLQQPSWFRGGGLSRRPVSEAQVCDHGLHGLHGLMIRNVSVSFGRMSTGTERYPCVVATFATSLTRSVETLGVGSLPRTPAHLTSPSVNPRLKLYE
jgi:hypothetical protein